LNANITCTFWKFSKLSKYSGISLNWSIDEVTTHNTTAYFLAHSVWGKTGNVCEENTPSGRFSPTPPLCATPILAYKKMIGIWLLLLLLMMMMIRTTTMTMMMMISRAD